MALNTLYPGHIVIADSPENIIFGTCEIANSFGEVKSADVKRTADQEMLNNAKGSLRACVLKNPRFELSLETLFTDDITAPGIGEAIGFPLVGVIGRILDVTPKWSDAGGRTLSITATSWDSLGASGSGAASCYNGSTWTAVVDTVAPPGGA